MSEVIGCYVDWKPVGGDFEDLKWVETSAAVQELGISQYRIYDAGPNTSQIWRYQLFFTSTKGWGFEFEDASHDKYPCSTVINGEHNIQYNSDQPDILVVRASP